MFKTKSKRNNCGFIFIFLKLSMHVHKRYLFLKDVDVAEGEETCDEMIEYDSPEQLGEQLVTLSSLPESRWKNLLNLDIIKVIIIGTPLFIVVFRWCYLRSRFKKKKKCFFCSAKQLS